MNEITTNTQSTILENWEEIYISIKATAIAREMKNTYIALSVAIRHHNGQFRKGGEPYIIHPLTVCKHLINLGIYDDHTCAASLLHDIKEDNDLTEEQTHKLFEEEYSLDTDVANIVITLSKDKNYKQTDPDEKLYYERIKKDERALIIKISDRANNLSTIDAFTKEKMIQYVDETKRLVYDLCKYGKKYYPDFSNAITIMKYQIQSICETIEAQFGIVPLKPDSSRYRKTFIFVRDYSKGKGLTNTLKAIFTANKLHKGDVRTSGDSFITHPLRVCSYLIALKVNEDNTCAAALLHEVLTRCNLPKGGEELVEDHGLDPEILKMIKLLSNKDGLTKEEYYNNLMTNKYAVMIKLSNRAHTCTRLSTYTDEEKKEYIEETRTYISKLCTDAQEEYPEFWDQIEIMKYHIFSICKIVEVIMKCQKESS